MSNLDGSLISEATAGINAPKEGDQSKVVRVDDAVYPDPPNLRYQGIESFAEDLAGFGFQGPPGATGDQGPVGPEGPAGPNITVDPGEMLGHELGAGAPAIAHPLTPTQVNAIVGSVVLTILQSLIMAERAAGATLAAGFGQFFPKNDAPSAPYFRDDTNVDRKLLVSPAPLTDMANQAAATVLLRALGAGSGPPIAGTATQLNAIIGSAVLEMVQSFLVVERAAGITLAAGQGQFFAKSDAPNNPYFRDDTNVDRKLATVPVPLTELANQAAATVLLRALGAGTGVPIAGTATQLNAIVGSAVLLMQQVLQIDAAQYLQLGTATPPASGAIRSGAALQMRSSAALTLTGGTTANLAAGTDVTVNAVGAVSIVAGTTLLAQCAGNMAWQSNTGSMGFTCVTAGIALNAATSIQLIATSSNVVLTSTNGAVNVNALAGTIALNTLATQPVSITSALRILSEQASHPAVAAGQCKIWLRDDTPNSLIFKDDTNVDRKIATAPVPLTDMAPQAAGTVLLRALGAGVGVPTAGSGAQVGAITRWTGLQNVPMTAGTTNTLAVTDGASHVYINITGTGDVIIDEITYGSNSSGASFILAKNTGNGRVILRENAAKTLANRITTPLTLDWVIHGGLSGIELNQNGFSWCIEGAPIIPAQLAPVAAMVGVLFITGPIAMVATGAAADDVVVYSANAPYPFRSVKMLPKITGGALLGSIHARNGLAGGGAQVSPTFGATLADDDPAITANNGLTGPAIALNGTFVIRRNNGNITGEVDFICVRT